MNRIGCTLVFCLRCGPLYRKVLVNTVFSRRLYAYFLSLGLRVLTTPPPFSSIIIYYYCSHPQPGQYPLRHRAGAPVGSICKKTCIMRIKRIIIHVSKGVPLKMSLSLVDFFSFCSGSFSGSSLFCSGSSCERTL